MQFFRARFSEVFICDYGVYSTCFSVRGGFHNVLGVVSKESSVSFFIQK